MTTRACNLKDFSIEMFPSVIQVKWRKDMWRLCTKAQKS